MADKIKIENLEVFARHGVFPEENRLGQKFLVSAVLYMDVREAGKTDKLGASADYGEVCRFIDTFMKEHTYKLIERAAESLAAELLTRIPKLEKVKVEIGKPWAPVGLPLKTVSVEIERQWHTAYVALGSNMGDRRAFLDGAVMSLGRLPHTKVVKVSSYYETPPYGMTEQADFLNGCLKLLTLLTPEELLDGLLGIEREAGRERVVRWGPRTLDLDIIFYDSLVLESEDLCIPHVEMHKRRFVLEPLCEIAPYKRHPVYGRTVREMLENIESASSEGEVKIP
ncbi:MAG: 2-amino-4-hydroxy-6-hydroxymethyldihydropteridine diphosphokinase [Dorea sp.]|nr:2-amino-4-hydroxy-6-hydroxymethyldihydropteridine diphosphokinase [Dorea sp.]